PLHQPATDSYPSARSTNSTPAGSQKVGGAAAARGAGDKTRPLLTQHTGLPPRDTGAGNPWDKREQAKAAAQARNQQAAKERADAAKGKGRKPPRKPVAPR
ncbi:MAG: YgiQ family radical SAM protein, partial [Pseudomonas sp.]